MGSPFARTAYSLPCLLEQINRIYHRSLMQIEKSQPEGKRITLEMRFTEFPALSVHRRVGISLSASETDDRFYLFVQVNRED